jgi:ParB-like nuclease domain
MAPMSEFTYDESFPLSEVGFADRRFMSRLDRDQWDQQVQALMREIAEQGLMAPVGIARIAGEHHYVVVYGFTRTEAMRRLGRETIRANVYLDLDEQDARILNAGDNAWHTQLTDWERALQMHKLRESGIPVDSANGGPSLVNIFGMSRRTVFNWLGVVTYPCNALHHAIEQKQIGLQQALIFREHPPEVTEAWLPPCIAGEWSSTELKLRLMSATDEAPTSAPAMSATLHGDEASASQDITPSATLHKDDEERSLLALQKAGRWCLEVSTEQLRALSDAQQQQLKDGLQMVLTVIAGSARRTKA